MCFFALVQITALLKHLEASVLLEQSITFIMNIFLPEICMFT